MPATSRTSLLDLQTDVWKSRAQAKQKWLERTLAEPATSAQDARHKTAWIRQALNAVKQGQNEIKYQSALLDVYASHLNALEMSLLAAAEQRQSEGSGSKSSGAKTVSKHQD